MSKKKKTIGDLTINEVVSICDNRYCSKCEISKFCQETGGDRPISIWSEKVLSVPLKVVLFCLLSFNVFAWDALTLQDAMQKNVTITLENGSVYAGTLIEIFTQEEKNSTGKSARSYGSSAFQERNFTGATENSKVKTYVTVKANDGYVHVVDMDFVVGLSVKKWTVYNNVEVES